MTTGNPIGKAKAVAVFPATESAPAVLPSNTEDATAFKNDADSFALGPNWRARASHLTKAASSALDEDHTSFSKLNHQIEIENAYAKMRRQGQGRRVPSGITALRNQVKPGRAPLDPTSIPAVPTLQEYLELSYTDWVDSRQRPNVLKNIGELFDARRTELQELAKQYRAQMKDANADPASTVAKIRLVERRLIELDQEVEALETHKAQFA